MFPFLQELLCLLEQYLAVPSTCQSRRRQPIEKELPHLLLPRVTDILVRIEQRSNVHGLAAPELSLDSPVEGQL